MSYEKYLECINACNECVIACEHCASSCLKEDDVKKMANCIDLDRSCADICSLAVRDMSRGSEFVSQICSLCVEVCQACGDECSKHNMNHCQQCAQTCYKCAEECRRMAA